MRSMPKTKNTIKQLSYTEKRFYFQILKEVKAQVDQSKKEYLLPALQELADRALNTAEVNSQHLDNMQKSFNDIIASSKDEVSNNKSIPLASIIKKVNNTFKNISKEITGHESLNDRQCATAGFNIVNKLVLEGFLKREGAQNNIKITLCKITNDHLNLLATVPDQKKAPEPDKALISDINKIIEELELNEKEIVCTTNKTISRPKNQNSRPKRKRSTIQEWDSEDESIDSWHDEDSEHDEDDEQENHQQTSPQQQRYEEICQKIANKDPNLTTCYEQAIVQFNAENEKRTVYAQNNGHTGYDIQFNHYLLLTKVVYLLNDDHQASVFNSIFDKQFEEIIKLFHMTMQMIKTFEQINMMFLLEEDEQDEENNVDIRDIDTKNELLQKLSQYLATQLMNNNLLEQPVCKQIVNFMRNDCKISQSEIEERCADELVDLKQNHLAIHHYEQALKDEKRNQIQRMGIINSILLILFQQCEQNKDTQSALKKAFKIINDFSSIMDQNIDGEKYNEFKQYKDSFAEVQESMNPAKKTRYSSNSSADNRILNEAELLSRFSGIFQPQLPRDSSNPSQEASSSRHKAPNKGDLKFILN